MSASRAGSVIIVGGGASGVMLAAQLLRSSSSSLRVTLVERRADFGRGMAYSTQLPGHLLNVSAFGMSALAEDPEHFVRWLTARGTVIGDTPFYAPRSLYGSYLNDLLSSLLTHDGSRLRLVSEEAVSITPTATGVEVSLANGTSLVGHAAVLAVGHDEQPEPALAYAKRIESDGEASADPYSTVMVLGSGLSMVDAWLTLKERRHRGRVVAVSRRGLLPSPHRIGRPLALDIAEIPLGTSLSYFVRWFRDLTRETERAGGNWRDVVDGLRPFNQRIWQSWPVDSKRRFLEHTKAWWDIHRHRMAPSIHARLTEAVDSGQLQLVAGRVVDVTPSGQGLNISVLRRQSRGCESFQVARVYDCTGVVKDVSKGSIAVVRSLIDRSLARPDPFRIGLDVTVECAVIDGRGIASDRIFAVGPLTRGTFFEIDAVPDIRAQCAALARHLAA